MFNGHGDVEQLTDTSGGVIKGYDYDEFGNERNIDANDANPFRYCGEYYDKETGTIYLRARYYNPATGRFITEDSYWGEDIDPLSLNLYTYTENNPICYLDPSGHIPTTYEAANMAEHIYDGKKGDKVSGWTLNTIIINDEGLKMGVYSRVKADGTTEYSLVNKGTTPTNFSDWVNNIQQPISYSDDMKDSISESTKFVNDHPNNEITMVGHSKGGAEATANAVATNKNCIIFNPATVNLSAYGLNTKGYTANMTAYIVKGEILNNIFGSVSKPIGKVVYLPNQNKTPWWVQGLSRDVVNLSNSIQNHLMGSVKKALKEEGYN
ncbi:RHS repeat-associated core domain-containing protein [Acetivibrio cellulolyticus]